MRVGNGSSYGQTIGHFEWRDYLLEHAAFSHYVKDCRIGAKRCGQKAIGCCTRRSAYRRSFGHRVKGQDAVFEPEQRDGCRNVSVAPALQARVERCRARLGGLGALFLPVAV